MLGHRAQLWHSHIPQSSGLVVRWVRRVGGGLGGPAADSGGAWRFVRHLSVVTELAGLGATCAFARYCWLCIPLGAATGVVPGRSTGAPAPPRHCPVAAIRCVPPRAGVLALLQAFRRGVVTAGSLVVHWATMQELTTGSPIRYSKLVQPHCTFGALHPTSSSRRHLSKAVAVGISAHIGFAATVRLQFWAAISSTPI